MQTKNLLQDRNYQVIQTLGRSNHRQKTWHLKHADLNHLFCSRLLTAKAEVQIGDENQELTCPVCIKRQHHFLKAMAKRSA